MTIQEVINDVLNLADEVGNETEYKDRIIYAINHVQAKISKFANRIEKYITQETENRKITMPDDFLSLVNIKDATGRDVSYVKSNNKEVTLEHDGIYSICYTVVLDNFTLDVNVDTEINIKPIAEECLKYGVAAEICMDNEELYPILQNEYNNLLANLEMSVDDIVGSGDTIQHIEGLWY